MMQRYSMLFLVLVAACVPRAPQAATPEVTAFAEARSPDDSAADRAALEALAELEFRSLDPRANRVRGALAVPAAEQPATSAPPVFGGAAIEGPLYDIDVVSFADHQRVQYYINFFVGPARNRFAIWLERLTHYEGMIRERLRAYGVPEDMVYLALIESGYSNTAVSRANAVGMWQFISSTGRNYGLTVDTWVDERRDPWLATDAAARHLRDLNERFGSWYLAAAAYNGGPGRVSRGLDRLHGPLIPRSDTTFFALYDTRFLRRETKDYVPKLIAAALVAKDPARYGFTVESVPEAYVFDEITVEHQTGLDVLARLADTTATAILELNPRFYRGATPPDRRVTVRVPRGSGATVAQRWADLPARERVSFIEHRIAAGETLGQIARRYGVSVDLIQAANRGVEARRLRIGARLVIPLSTAARANPAAVRPAAAPAAVLSATHHTVRSGESLWTVSQRYRVTVAQLRAWNDIPVGSILRVGQRLQVSGRS